MALSQEPPLDLATHHVLALETREGLLLWPYERVALLMDEVQGRLTVVSDQGEVAHRTSPLAARLAGPPGPPGPCAPRARLPRVPRRMAFPRTVEGLRDWPHGLLLTPADEIRRAFGCNGSERSLMANVVWETLRLGQQGRPPDHGTDTRGFWYRPLAPILARIRGELLPLEYRDSSDARYRLLVDLLGDMVGHRRLLTFRDLGFVAPRPDLRFVGSLGVRWDVGRDCTTP